MSATYVMGYLFDNDGRDVILVKKRAPWWLAGKLSGISDVLESRDTSPLQCMERIAWQDVGARHLQWKHFAAVRVLGPPGAPEELQQFCFAAFGSGALRSKTGEELVRVPYDAVMTDNLDITPSLRWMLPLGLLHLTTEGARPVVLTYPNEEMR